MTKPNLRLNTPLHLVVAVAACAALSACNFRFGDSDGSGSNPGGGDGGSDGGASIGVLTDAGALEVNLNSDFSLTAGGTVRIDGEEVDANELKDGMVAKLKLEETVADDFSSGTATEIDANHLFIGPVTTTAPLSVLGQQVTVLEETEIDGIRNDSTANLSVGDIVRVSGYSNRLGGNIATRVDAPTGGSGYWWLTGIAEDLVANDAFTIEGQRIVLNGVIPDCATGLANGALVAVKATPIPSFTNGDDIDTTLAVTCQSIALPKLVNDDQDIDELPAEMEGIVMEISNRSEFTLDDQAVEISNNVSFTGGEESDFMVGAKVEVEGTLDPDSAILTANRIIFHQRPIEIEAPLTSSDVTINESVRFFGLDITTNKLVVEDDLIVSGGQVDQQVRLNGFVDEEQVPYAIQLSIRGVADDEDITLKGPVSDVESNGFDIMGISVEGSSAASLVGSLKEEDVVRIENAETDGDDGIKDGEASLIN